MKKQELRKLIREEIKNALNETNAEFDELASKLIGLAYAGSIDNNDIKNLSQELLTARRKMIAAKQSPEQRRTSAAKGQLTAKWNKLRDDALDLTDKALNISDAADQFALSIGMHRDKELQAKYSMKYRKIISDLGSKAGLGEIPERILINH